MVVICLYRISWWWSSNYACAIRLTWKFYASSRWIWTWTNSFALTN